MACHTSWFPLLHRDLLLMIMSFAISFFLIGNQKYPPHLWLILGLANGYLMVRGWQGWSLQQFKDVFDAKPEEQRVRSSRLQPALPHRSWSSHTAKAPAAQAPWTQSWWHTMLMREHISGTPHWHWPALRWALSYQQWEGKNSNTFRCDSAQHFSKMLK